MCYRICYTKCRLYTLHLNSYLLFFFFYKGVKTELCSEYYLGDMIFYLFLFWSCPA